MDLAVTFVRIPALVDVIGHVSDHVQEGVKTHVKVIVMEGVTNPQDKTDITV